MRSYKLVEACYTLHSGRSFRICKDRAIGARDCGGRIGCCTLRLRQKHRRPQSGLCSQNSSVNRLLETMLWKRLCKAGIKFVTAAAFPSGFTECRMDFLAGGAAKAPGRTILLEILLSFIQTVQARVIRACIYVLSSDSAAQYFKRPGSSL